MTVNVERLEKLAKFLDTLPADKFDFNEVVTYYDGQGCGSICCAIGWCPKIFPEQIQWDSKDSYDVLFVNRESVDYIEAAMVLFGIESEDANILFTPVEEILREGYEDDNTEKLQQEYPWYVQTAGADAKPSDVAKNIRSYILYHGAIE
ncbi:MAG: hypothetical protein F6K62_17575 [Sphaerospermopsis sp. SIO1G2]|nr:hypothetical protein [Sphaerospermopsis sp. SIO1G2]